MSWASHRLFLGKGVLVLLKLAILLNIPSFWDHRVTLLLVVVVIAPLGSHMPARHRHYSFLHCRVVQAGETLPLGSSTKQVLDNADAHQCEASGIPLAMVNVSVSNGAESGTFDIAEGSPYP